jgi:hypothetical protein
VPALKISGEPLVEAFVQLLKNTAIGNDKNFASRKPSFLLLVIFLQSGKEETPAKIKSKIFN